ncbi:MAG: chromosomal replication initiator protein DnaA [Planctomycetota bacterium]|nr:chromosomal replication initiator protein DnaA [Planctomycetota bacterium]
MSRPVDSNETLPAGLLEKVLGELKHSVRKEHYETWFRGLTLRAVQGDRYVFGVPSGFVRDWLRKNYLSMIEDAVRLATGRRRCGVALQLARGAEGEELGLTAEAAAGIEFAERGVTSQAGLRNAVIDAVEPDAVDPDSIDPDSIDPDSIDLGARTARSQGSAAPSAQAAPADRGPEIGFQRIPRPGTERGPLQHGAPPAGEGRYSGSNWDRLSDLGDLNRSYTFDQFVVGPCNRLSHAAALAVAENPGRAYNPLFIHGNVGLGKTHLLQAICHEIRRKNERARVLYLSCEEFTNRFIHAIQSGRLDEFRELHRSVDVLVVDDIQFLANKDKTQDEFFHTFNALYNTNRQIIISSDRSPTEIPTIEERLVSRFRWGLVAEMEVPCFETRVAIVRRKARLRQLDLPEDVAYFIAERIDTNIRELEGAVVKVIGVASITDREVSVELAEEALRGVVVQRSRQVSVSEIMGLVTEEFSISARDMIGKSRTQAISLPRQISMYLCRQLTDQSLEEVGRYFGGRDHTTVLYAVKKIEKRVKDDKMFRELVSTLTTRLQG